MSMKYDLNTSILLLSAPTLRPVPTLEPITVHHPEPGKYS